MLAKARPLIGAFIAILIAGGLLSVSLLSDRGSDAEPAHSQRLVIYSSTDEGQFQPVLDHFRAANPSIEVEYLSLPAQEVYARTRSEIDAGRGGADLVISSSMDLQVKLVNDLYSQPYDSPESGSLPDWAVWKNEAFAVTSEPIVIGYNKRLLEPSLRPSSHDHLTLLLREYGPAYSGRIGIYDADESPSGYLYFNQDLHIDNDNWELIAALGQVRPQLFTSTNDMIDKVISGDLLIAYNLIGSYALKRAAENPDFGVVIPEDYVLIGSRVALITRSAQNVDAARRFLDFMLSATGQDLLSQHYMIPLRADLQRGDGLLQDTNVRIVDVGPALMADLDSINQHRFLTRWKSNLEYQE